MSSLHALCVQMLMLACQFVMKTTTLCVTVYWVTAEPRTCLSDFSPSQEHCLLTFFPCGEELLDSIIEADPKRGEAYLSLETSRQPAVEFHWPFCFCQSDDCSQDAFIPNGTGGQAFALDLEVKIERESYLVRKKQRLASSCPQWRKLEPRYFFHCVPIFSPFRLLSQHLPLSIYLNPWVRKIP